MRIGIDARPLKFKEYSGIPRVVFEVLRVWMEKYPEHEYYLISNTNIEIPIELPDNWHKVIVPGAFHNNGTIWQIYKLKSVVKKLSLDVYWGTNYMLPFSKISGCKYLLTIHDLAFYRFKRTSSWKTSLVLKLFLKPSSKLADYIHVVSDSTKADVVKYLGIDQEKIHTVYLGFNENKKSLNCKEELPEYKYFMVLGTIEPRKNPMTILKAYEHFLEECSEEVHLVFAGKMGWRMNGFRSELEKSQYLDRIHILGFITEERKQQLLANAEALLFPSLYEGFGIPILESMNAKTPVITSRVSSMPEVAGNAAFYIDDVYDYKMLANIMNAVLDMNTADREALDSKMADNLKKFSWDECARQIMDIID